MTDLLALIAQRNAEVYRLALSTAAGAVIVFWMGRAWRAAGITWPRLPLPPLPAARPIPALDWVIAHWWGLTVGLAVTVRLVYFDLAPYWYDEAFSVWLAGLPFGQMWAAVAGDVHPPGHYLILWGLANLTGSTGPLVMRGPSFLAGLAGLFLVRRLGEAVNLPRPAVAVGCLLLAISPYQLYYSNEARVYAVFQLATLGAMWAIVRRRYLWAAAAWAAMLWTHNYGLIFGLALGALALAREFRLPVRPVIDPPWYPAARQASQWQAVIMAGGLALAAWAPWVPVFLRQLGNVSASHWIWPVSWAEIIILFQVLFVGAGQYAYSGLALMVVIVGLLYAGWRLARERVAGVDLLLYLCLAPVILAAVISLVRPIFIHRYLLPVAAPLALVVGWLVTTSPRRAQFALALFVLPMVIMGLPYAGRDDMRARGQPGAVADIIRANYRPWDVIYHTDIWTRVELEALLPGYNHILAPIAVDGLNVGGLTPETRRAMGIVEADLSRMDFRRAWIVTVTSPTAAAPVTSDYLGQALALGEARRLFATQDTARLFGAELWLLLR